MVKKLYEDLYAERKQPINNDINNLNPTQLTQPERELLEQDITKKEIEKALSQLKNNKSPGTDGYSAEFYKTFWPQIGYYFHDCINQCYLEGNLTETQTEGLISCLPKGGKARNLLKNWRPISLLNTAYKLISMCITNRMRQE